MMLACTGCEAVLGLGETSYAPDAAAGDARSDAPVDACAAASCMTFASCRVLEQQFPTAPSGVYMLDAGTGSFRAYCELDADGGGWTLAMKVDGNNSTFRHDEAIWTDSTLLGTDTPDLDGNQAKLETFNAIAFTELRVGFEFPIGSATRRWLVLPIAGSRLRDLFAGAESLTALGRDAWKGMLGPTASLQLECNREGINVGNSYARVRIGIIGNNEADCLTPDSRLGIGGADMAQCMFATPETAGNSACYLPDNGEIEQAAFGYVFVR